MLTVERYRNGDYAAANPEWHMPDSPWKARQIMKCLTRNSVEARTFCEVGCGAGAILAELHRCLPEDTTFRGYEISSGALAMCAQFAGPRIRFEDMHEFFSVREPFDIVLVMDVIEHLEDPFHFLREVRDRGVAKIFHIPLDLSVQGLMRNIPARLRESAGHLNYFTADLALRLLAETGYLVVDSFYTLPSVEGSWESPLSRIAKLPRRLSFSVSPPLPLGFWVVAHCWYTPFNGA